MIKRISIITICLIIGLGSLYYIGPSNHNSDLTDAVVLLEVEKENLLQDQNKDLFEDNLEMGSLEVAEDVVEDKDNSLNEASNPSVSTPPRPNQATAKAPTSEPSPITGNSYTVQRGDSLYSISKRANIPVDRLVTLNNIKGDTIVIGQTLALRGEVVNRTAQASTNVASRGTSNTNSESVYWLSRIIHAEAQGEPYEGKVAVGNVILNRVKSSLFPNTIHGVIFDKQHGYTQFSPVLDGSINNTPNDDSVRAAIQALNGSRPVGEALYFLNPDKATNFWIVSNRRFYKRIGDHDFYY